MFSGPMNKRNILAYKYLFNKLKMNVQNVFTVIIVIIHFINKYKENLMKHSALAHVP